jgi:hypothetical protein
MKYKIHIPKLNADKDEFIRGSLKILFDGINEHEKLMLADSESDCDFIFLDFRHQNKYDVKFPQKTIMIDYTDSQKLLKNIPKNILLYFKRSVVDTSPVSLHDYGDRQIIPISYCVKDEAMERNVSPLLDRNIDVSILFKPEAKTCRGRITGIIQQKLSNKYKVHTGLVGNAGEIGRNTIQMDYYRKILDSKIIVTVNPDNWEGDWRLFEALSCSPLVMVDRMLTPVKNNFVDGKHLVYYDTNKLDVLLEKIDYYMENLDKSQTIATSGYNHTLKHHTAKNRMDEILEEINKRHRVFRI